MPGAGYQASVNSTELNVHKFSTEEQLITQLEELGAVRDRSFREIWVQNNSDPNRFVYNWFFIIEI